MKINGTMLGEPLTGTSSDDQIYGFGGDDTIHGGGGNDTIDGGAGENWLYGDAGNDTIYSMVPAGHGYHVDHIDGGADTDTLYLQRDFAQYGWGTLSLDLTSPKSIATLQDGTTITGIENLNFYGGNESDVVTGGVGNNALYGGGGIDTLKGGPHADVIDGGSGADFLYGNGGDDIIFSFGTDPDKIDGGDGIDVAEIHRDAATMSYNFALKTDSATPQDIGDGTTLAHVEKLFFWGGSGGDHVTGGDYDDVLHGGVGDDTLNGGGGNNYLDGGDNNDYIVSNDFAGFDTIDGGDGNDRLFLSRMWSTEDLHLDLTDPTMKQTIGDGGVQQHGLAGTTVVNIESVEFWGGGGDDVITGGKFSDDLFGGDGNDRLFGGTQSGGLLNVDRLDGGNGNDTLIGGPAADHFIFDTPLDPAQNVDHITDFTVANDRGIQQDTIWLSDNIFTALSPNMDEQLFHQSVKEAPNGDLFYQGTLFAHVDAPSLLTYSNFHIFDGYIGVPPIFA